MLPPASAFRIFWRQRKGFARRRDWLLRLYNGIANRLPVPGRGAVWAVRVKGIDEPVRVRQGSADWIPLAEVLLFGEYDFALSALKHEPIRQIVDLGANVGYTLCLWRQHFPDADVIAVEPDADSLSACRRHAAPERGSGSVTFLHAAAAARAGHANLDRSGPSTVFRVVEDSEHSLTSGSTELLEMSTILSRGGSAPVIDLLKCDIEGSERAIFQDCSIWIHRLQYLLIELHDGYRANDLAADLAANGAKPTILAVKPKAPPVEIAFLRLNRAQAEVRK